MWYHGEGWCNGNVINLDFHCRGIRFESCLGYRVTCLRSYLIVYNSPPGQYWDASCLRRTATACFQSMQENTRLVTVSVVFRPRGFSPCRKIRGIIYLLWTTIACIQSLQEYVRIAAVSVGLRLLALSHFHFVDGESFCNRRYKFWNLEYDPGLFSLSWKILKMKLGMVRFLWRVALDCHDWEKQVKSVRVRGGPSSRRTRTHCTDEYLKNIKCFHFLMLSGGLTGIRTHYSFRLKYYR